MAIVRWSIRHAISPRTMARGCIFGWAWLFSHRDVHNTSQWKNTPCARSIGKADTAAKSLSLWIFNMKFYFAPLEGITGFTFRNLHHKHFGGMDAYYAPFIQPKQTHELSTKELKDVAPENNAQIRLIPQIMASHADNFIWSASELLKHGYSTINLNLGCPMPTIVTRGKGSGLLAKLDELKVLLDSIYDDAEKNHYRISIKTRLGKDNFDDVSKIVELYNQYPVSELIVHPRCQKDLYKNYVNWDAFEQAMQVTKHRICYNGDIFSRKDYDSFVDKSGRYAQIESIMLARGIIANPALLREIKGGKSLSVKELQSFERELYDAYLLQNIGFSAVSHRMKELWFYWGMQFPENEKQVHKIRISRTVEEYRSRVDSFWAQVKR